MERKRIRAFFLNARKREIVTKRIFSIIIILICVFLLFTTFYLKNKKQYITYTEKGELDYKVYLKQNDFFKTEFLGSENEYVASLIDYINANFSYKINVEKADVNYSYKYRVEAVVDIIREDTKTTLYNYKEEIENIEEETDNKKLTLEKFVKIDYNKYNETAKSFISLYDLENAVATLTINFYIDINGNSESFERQMNNENVYSLCMPLNENTINLEVKNDVNDEKDNIIVCKKSKSNSYWLLIVGTILTLLDIYKIVDLFKYIMRNRTAESIYERELKKILNNYGSYIQKINNEFDTNGYTKLEVDTFYDMLEIRETIQEPIMMLENADKTETYFMILGKMNIIYVYYIRVSDMKKRKSKKHEEVEL